MNEYTRREEVRATFIASAILVLCIAAAVFRLVTVEGGLVPDPNARRVAQESEIRVNTARTCAAAGKTFGDELDLFKKLAKSAQLGEPPRPEPPPPRGGRGPTLKLPSTQNAQRVPFNAVLHKQAKMLASCREGTEAALDPARRPELAPAWAKLDEVGKIAPPPERGDEAAEAQATRKMFDLVKDLAPEKVQQATRDAEAHYKAEADRDKTRAATAVVREPLPEGLLSRRTAVSLGVGLTVVALLVSYLSVRVASMRRLAMLVPLRDAARTGTPGAQTAAILKAAASHNGGEPGLVIGSALGGLLAALLKPADADLFVAGVMAGLLVGLAVQWGVRLALGASRWRARAAELAEIEKPAIPIVLVMSGVNPGLEPQFIQYLRSLSPEDASNAVEKLASQAEERILAQAEAQRAAAVHAAQQAAGQIL